MGGVKKSTHILYSKILGYCSKYKNAYKTILEFSVAQAVLDYNVGYTEGFVIPHLGDSYTFIQQKSLENKDFFCERQRVGMKRKEMRGDDSMYKAGGF